MQKTSNNKHYNYVDLFAGAGGLSLGFDEEGYNNVFAIEYDQNFAKTYQHNFPSHNLIVKDIKTVSNDDMIKESHKNKIDIVIGGPPCQGFSIAGNIGRTFLDDDRNKLFLEFVRTVDVLNPKVFMLENVAALATHKKGKTIEEIVNCFKNTGKGYSVKWKIVNTAKYGIPQERRRIIVVGIRKDINVDFEFPEETNEQHTIKEAIGDLPKLKSGESSNIPNHIAMEHSEQMLEKMSYIPDGGDRTSIPEDIRPQKGDVRKYIRYNSKKPSICITGDMRKVFHYSQNRALTPRELARIQTFPDSFVFEGTSIQIQQQIGNAVPPQMARIMAKSLKEILNNA